MSITNDKYVQAGQLADGESFRYYCSFYKSKQPDKNGKFNILSNYFDRFKTDNPDNGKLILLPAEFADKVELNKIYICELQPSYSHKSFKVISLPVLANDLLEMNVTENTIDVMLNGEVVPYYCYVPSKNSDHFTARDKMSAGFANWDFVMSRVAFTVFLNKFDAECKILYKELKKNAKKSFKKDYEVNQARPNQTAQFKPDLTMKSKID